MTDGPLIVQSDKTLLLEVDHPLAAEARSAIAPFAELGAVPARAHLPPDPARAVGTPEQRADAEQVVDALVPLLALRGAARASRRRRRHDGPVRPAATDQAPHPRAGSGLAGSGRARGGAAPERRSRRYWASASTPTRSSSIRPSAGRLKQALLKVGWPADDLAGYVDGQAHPIELHGGGLALRDYQKQAVANFWAGGSGVVVLPAARARHSSAPPPWPRPRPRPSSW